MNDRNEALTLEVLEGGFSVCKVADYSGVDLEAGFCFTGRTDAERSLVCETDRVPGNTLARDDGWSGFRVRGTLDFALTGILARLSAVLADARVGIFAVSTYDTDYVFVKTRDLERALDALAGAGYRLAR